MNDTSIRYLTADEVKQCITMSEAITVVRGAFEQLSAGSAAAPLRTRIDIDSHAGKVLFMPAYLPDTSALGVKVVTLFSGNPAKGLPLIDALVVVIDGTNGRPAAVMDGEFLTAVRTGAASGLAADLLSRTDSKTAALFGAGPQSRTQLEGVLAVRPLELVRVYDPVRERAAAFAAEITGKYNISADIMLDPSGIEGADIICTATPSEKPVFSDRHLSPGTHINAVGSYTPQMCEIPEETVCRSLIFVDQIESCLKESGDLIGPVKSGRLDPDDIRAEIGDVAAGRAAGRKTREDITFFKTVGNAVQDMAVADFIVKKAAALKLGTMLPR